MCLILFLMLFIKNETMAAGRIKVTGVSVSNVINKKLTIEKGKTYQLKTKVTPSNASNKKLSFSSSNKKIATVSSSGKIKAVKNGTVTIKVIAKDGSKKSSSIQVTVGKRVKKIQITNTGSQITVGNSFTLKTTISPSSASNKKLKYTSSNSKVLKVSSTGVVKAVSVPDSVDKIKVSLTVQSVDGGNVKAVKQLTVIKKKASEPSVSKPSLEKSYIAHMGFSSKAPANTVPAFKLAATSGAFTGIETDLRQTKDGKFVLYHDDDLSTRTTGSGSVESKTYAEISKYRVKKGTDINSYSKLKVPTLEEYLKICKTYHMQPVIHIKSLQSTGYKKLLDLLEDYGLFEETIITGGKAVMAKFRSLNKKITLSWICYMSIPGIDWAAENNIQINSSYEYVTRERVEYAKSKGLSVWAWTVNKKTLAEQLWGMNVDAITTDYKF